jgi:signal peptidase II
MHAMAAEDATEPAAHPEPVMGRWAKIGFGVAAVVIVLDQIVKWVMLRAFGDAPFSELCRSFRESCGGFELTPIFDLTMVWNRGVSFGLFQAETGFGRWALVVFSCVVAGLLGWLLRKAHRPLNAIAFGLVIGGALGNMIDRARFGAVVDFFDFSGLWFPWVFNVADAAISIGAALIVLELLLEPRKPRAESSAS